MVGGGDKRKRINAPAILQVVSYDNSLRLCAACIAREDKDAISGYAECHSSRHCLFSIADDMCAPLFQCTVCSHALLHNEQPACKPAVVMICRFEYPVRGNATHEHHHGIGMNGGITFYQPGACTSKE